MMIFIVSLVFLNTDAKFARYQRFMNYHNVRKKNSLSILYLTSSFQAERENHRATQFINFHTNDQPSTTQAPEQANHHNFLDVVKFCEEADPRNEIYLCKKVKMLNRHLENNRPAVDNHDKWKLCDRLLQRQDHPDRITRSRLDGLCLSYMQLLYKTTRSHSFLTRRGSNGRSKVYNTHFGNNWSL